MGISLVCSIWRVLELEKIQEIVMFRWSHGELRRPKLIHLVDNELFPWKKSQFFDLLVAQDEKSGDYQSQKKSFSGEHSMAKNKNKKNC